MILVVDSSERECTSTVKHELGRLLANEDLADAALLVLANKQDVAGAMTASELSAALCLHNIADKPWSIAACCALTGEGLPEALDWIAANVTKR